MGYSKAMKTEERIVNKSITPLYLLVFIALMGTTFAQQGGLVRERNGEEHRIPPNYLSGIRVNSSGAIRFQDELGEVHTLNRNEYTYVFTPAAKKVQAVEFYYMRLDFDKTIKAAEAVPDAFLWLGWGAYVNYLKGMAQIHKGDFAGAAESFKAGKTYARHEDRKELIDSALYELRLSKSGGSAAAATNFFNMKCQGIVQEKSAGNDKTKMERAILSYMKCILLYQDSKKEYVQLVRLTTFPRLINLLNKINDRSTAGYFKQMLQQEE